MRYIVTGKVLPERADINFSKVEWHSDGDGSVSAVCDSLNQGHAALVVVLPKGDSHPAARPVTSLVMDALIHMALVRQTHRTSLPCSNLSIGFWAAQRRNPKCFDTTRLRSMWQAFLCSPMLVVADRDGAKPLNTQE